uniref:Uncharacterized protein n=1 Tax=Ditylenchus dipsaci TaxID=166011 RepID=A0A915EB77_9BILA
MQIYFIREFGSRSVTLDLQICSVAVIVYEINAYLSCSLAFFFNLLLVCLIWKKTTKEMKTYSFILLQTCVIDLWLVSVIAFVQPVGYFIQKMVALWQVKQEYKAKLKALEVAVSESDSEDGEENLTILRHPLFQTELLHPNRILK